MDQFMRKCVMDRKIVEQLIFKKSFNEIEKNLKVGKKRRGIFYSYFFRKLFKRRISNSLKSFIGKIIITQKCAIIYFVDRKEKAALAQSESRRIPGPTEQWI